MAVNNWNGFMVRDGDVIGLNANQRPVFLMSFVDCYKASTATALIKEPQVGECSYSWAGDVTYGMRADVRQEIEEEGQEKQSVRCKQK